MRRSSNARSMRRSAAPIYGREIAAAEAAGRIARVAHEPRLPVHTAWDLGVGDATAIWFYQLAGREIRLIDYYEASGAGLDHYARELQRRGYAYGEHILPHDARVQELGSGKTRVETLTSLGFRPRVLASHKLDDGISAARLLLARCWFDAEPARAGSRRCGTTAANGTRAGRPSASARCTTGRATGRMRSATWRWGSGRGGRSGCRRSGMTIGGWCSCAWAI